MGDIRSQFYVVEMFFVDFVRKILPSAVPRHLIVGIALFYVVGEFLHLCRCRVASHKADAGDRLAIDAHQASYLGDVQRLPDILPQVFTVTARAVARTAGEVYGEGRLVGNFLKYDICVPVFKHRFMWFSDF